MLESSLLQWMWRLGVISDSVSSIVQVESDLRNGIIFADIITKSLNQWIPGIFHHPKSEATCLSNVRKVMARLWLEQHMSQGYVWKEWEVVKGDRGVIIAILEDMHRMSDGLPKRRPGRLYHKDGPYLGTWSELAQTIKQSNVSSPISWGGKRRWRQKSMGTSCPKLIQFEPSKTAPFKHLDDTGTHWHESMQHQYDHAISTLRSLGLNIPKQSIWRFKDGVLLSDILSFLANKQLYPFLCPSSRAEELLNLKRAFSLLNR